MQVFTSSVHVESEDEDEGSEVRQAQARHALRTCAFLTVAPSPALHVCQVPAPQLTADRIFTELHIAGFMNERAYAKAMETPESMAAKANREYAARSMKMLLDPWSARELADMTPLLQVRRPPA